MNCRFCHHRNPKEDFTLEVPLNGSEGLWCCVMCVHDILKVLEHAARACDHHSELKKLRKLWYDTDGSVLKTVNLCDQCWRSAQDRLRFIQSVAGRAYKAGILDAKGAKS